MRKVRSIPVPHARRFFMAARTRSRLGLVMLLTTMLASAAFALPKTVDKVDPKAPCFRWPAVDSDHDGVFDRIDRCDNTPLGAIVDKWGCPIDSDHDGVYDGLDKCPDTPAGEKVDANGCSSAQLAALRTLNEPRPVPPPAPAPPVQAPPATETERQLVESGHTRLENVFFETGSAKLLPESEAALDEAGRILEKYPDLRVEVQGHTDTRGSNAYNLKLSQARAESVRAYLLSHFRLGDDRLVAKGYGESQPETKERNDEERLRNRRVVIKALNPEVLPHGVTIH